MTYGTIIKNGVIYSGGGGGGVTPTSITKAEYDALSSEEQNEGLYFIEDWTPEDDEEDTDNTGVFSVVNGMLCMEFLEE